MTLSFALNGRPHSGLGLETLRASLSVRHLMLGTHRAIPSSFKILIYSSYRLPRTRRSSSWFSKLVERLDLTELLPEEDRPSSQPPPAAPAPPFVSESAPPPLAESVPTSQPPPRHPPPPSPQPQLREGAVGELIKRNQDVYDKIINHRFPQALGNGTASLDGFRYYMIASHL